MKWLQAICCVILLILLTPAHAQSPRCVYRYYSGLGGGYCDGCNVGYPTTTTPSYFSQMRQFGIYCQSCGVRCAQSPNRTTNNEIATPSCPTEPVNGEHLKNSVLYGIESVHSNQDFKKVVQKAPEIALAIFTSSIRNGKALQIDQTHTVTTSSVIPSRAFVEAAISGIDEEFLQRYPVKSLHGKKHLRIESWAHPIAPNLLEVKYVSSLVASPDHKDGTILNQVVLYLQRVDGSVSVAQYSDVKAEKYAIRSIDL